MKSLLSALSFTVCTITAAALSGGTAISSAQAQSFQPAIVFDMGGKFDKSFNEAAYNGAERFKKETGIAYREFEVTRKPSASRRCATWPGAAPDRRRRRLRPGQRHGEGLQGISRHQVLHHRRVVERPNVQSIMFKEHEGSFLVGMMAAHGVQDRQGRLRRRHGHSADPQLRLRLRAGRQARQSAGRDLPEHDRHHAGRLERPDQWR